MAARRRKISKRTADSRGSSKRSREPRVALALAAVQRAAGRLKAPWYLFGAQAVALHGVPRTTADVDVTILWNEEAERVVDALRSAGIEPLVDDPEFIAGTRVIPARHAASGWRLDIVLGGPGLEEQIAADAVKMSVGSLEVPVLRLEHLVVLKLLAQRPQDIADVARLLSVRGDAIQVEEVRELLVALEVGLEESGLVSRFDELLSAQGPGGRKKPVRRRGS